MFIDEKVKSESVDVVSTDSSSAIKTVESKVESIDVKNKGVCSTIETKPVKKNNFSPPIIEDWIFDDENKGNPQHKKYKEKEVIDSGFSRHMTRNKCYLTEYEDYDGGFVSFGDGKGRISGKDFLRCDNGTEFKNGVMNQFCDKKGIKREFSVARTPQQNGVIERKNKTLIEVTRTMLVYSKFPTTFWAEAVNTACYVLNRTLVIKPHNMTPYELIRKRPPLIDFIKLFGCQVEKKKEPEQEYILIPICTTTPLISQGLKDSSVDVGKKATEVDESQVSDNGGQDD
uniref:Putative ribonuclease H-like domain-containing protein n=1 Tax=Tanacetum cinerariifolium TaxID=118510 RepID=A0A699J3W5_TANCI|nr:putative ribonuclease H-like domain-containing protein [Tanacetum cinerariifolium]